MSHSVQVGFNGPGVPRKPVAASVPRPGDILRWSEGHPISCALWAMGVGSMPSEYPDAFAVVGSAEVGSSQHEPCSMIPDFGQVSEYSSKSARSEHWGVFHVCVAGLYFANDSVHFRPEAGAGAGDAGSFSCCADVLTGEAACDDVDVASEGCGVEGADVVPDGEWGEDAVALPGEEDGAGVGFDFAGGDCMPAK